MAEEILKRDGNHVTVLGGITDDSNQYVTMLRVDPTTKRLKVSASLASVGTVTSISQGTGILLSSNPITTTGSVSLATSLQPMATLAGNALKYLRVNAGETAVEYATVAAGGITIGTTTITSGTTTRILYDNAGVVGEYTITGTGTVVAMATSPVFTTPNIGVATATSVNGLTITASTGTFTLTNAKTLAVTNTLTLSGTDSTVMTFPTTSATIARTDTGQTFIGTNAFGVITATTLNGNTFTTGTYTLTGVAGKTLTFNKSITLEGTDSTTMTFPTTSATIARTDAAQTFTGTQTYSNAVIYTNNAITASGNAATVPVTAKLNTVTNNSAATLTITMTTTSAVDGQMTIVRILDSSAAAQTITWVNTENSTVSAPTTSNGSTTLFLTAGFIYNGATSKWRCIASA